MSNITVNCPTCGMEHTVVTQLTTIVSVRDFVYCEDDERDGCCGERFLVEWWYAPQHRVFSIELQGDD